MSRMGLRRELSNVSWTSPSKSSAADWPQSLVQPRRQPRATCGWLAGGGAAPFDEDEVAPASVVLADAFADADDEEPGPGVWARA